MALKRGPKKLGKVLFFQRSENGRTFNCCGYTAIHPYGTALNIYANVPNPASQILEGDTEEEVEKECEKRIEQMKNISWVEKNIDPYL